MGFEGIARKGISHQYTSRLVAFEHTPHNPPSPPQNVLLFVGGLFDGLHTVPYTSALAEALPPSWTLAEALLSSSYTGWGISSLQRDVKELSACVSYFRTIKGGKIVIMGHSTGCQDVMEYLAGKGHIHRAPIDGGILQAPVSDREAMILTMKFDVYRNSCDVAQAMVNEGKGKEILPSKETNSFFPAPVSANRWLSLASPHHDGDDDYFSYDLTDDQLMKTFGRLPSNSPLCVLISGADEFVGEGVFQADLLQRWSRITKRGGGKVDQNNSGVISGASHNLGGNPVEVVSGLVGKVLGFLDSLPQSSSL